MNLRKTFLTGAAAAALVAAGGLGAPARADHKAPYKFEADVNIPLPTHDPGGTQACGTEHPLGDQNTFTHLFNAEAPGTLTVEATGFEGDWDIGILDDKGKYIGGGDNAAQTPPTGVGIPEKAKLRLDKPRNLVIRVCNFLGTPSGHVKIQYTYIG